MKPALLLVTLIAAVMLAAVAIAATPVANDPTPQVTQLKKQLRTANAKISDLQDNVDAQNDLLADQASTITRLRTRLANQPDPIDVITSRDPDGLWAAAQAIWRAFPTLTVGILCGYDKGSTQDDALTPASISFYRYSTC